ncbi:MAG: carotenoid biosynthesis protein [Promethearchaeota archaeon]
MSFLELLPALVGYIMCGLAIIHALFDARENRVQRFLMLITLFAFGFLLEYNGVISGNYVYGSEPVMLLGIIPLSVTFAWVGIIYSAMIIGERLKLPLWQRILTTTLITLSLDWGMDPIAVELGAWTWSFLGGDYFGIPGFNFIGWFFIPIAYLIPYGLSWNKESKKFHLLTINEIDENNSLGRKLYTCLVVVPIAMLILIVVGLICKINFIYDLHWIILLIWMLLTVVFAAGTIAWKRVNLKRSKWFDLIPPGILLFIAYFYLTYSLLLGFFNLSLLMIFTTIPLLLAFVFTLLKKRD